MHQHQIQSGYMHQAGCLDCITMHRRIARSGSSGVRNGHWCKYKVLLTKSNGRYTEAACARTSGYGVHDRILTQVC